MTPSKHFEELIAYVAGDLDEARSEAFEERLFTDPYLASEAAWVARLHHSIREIAAPTTELTPVVSERTAAELRRRGSTVRQFELSPDADNRVHVDSDVTVVLIRFGGLDLRGADRVDLEMTLGGMGIVFGDMPFATTAEALTLACSRDDFLGSSLSDTGEALQVRVLGGEGDAIAEYSVRVSAS